MIYNRALNKMEIPLDSLVQGLATGIPIVISTVVLLYRFKIELCNQINDLKVEFHTHLGIAENNKKDFENVKEQLTNHILGTK